MDSMITMDDFLKIKNNIEEIDLKILLKKKRPSRALKSNFYFYNLSPLIYIYKLISKNISKNNIKLCIISYLKN